MKSTGHERTISWSRDGEIKAYSTPCNIFFICYLNLSSYWGILYAMLAGVVQPYFTIGVWTSVPPEPNKTPYKPTTQKIHLGDWNRNPCIHLGIPRILFRFWVCHGNQKRFLFNPVDWYLVDPHEPWKSGELYPVDFPVPMDWGPPPQVDDHHFSQFPNS